MKRLWSRHLKGACPDGCFSGGAVGSGMNRLVKEKSAYLKHAARQKIDWYPWGEEAFERARKESKPLFMSSGAAWCHWCHVMTEESFNDEETISLLNENFISIKLDRDERPDIDKLYQQAAAVMGAGGGWPLSVFLTPDKKPFFAGTYFPPDDRLGRPGFKKILRTVSDLYVSKKEEVFRYTEKLVNALKREPFPPGEIKETGRDVHSVNDIIRRGKGKLLAARDRRHTPFVDRNIYTSLNAILITACLKASRILGCADAGDFALKSLEKIMELRLINNELYHSEGVRAQVEDYMYLIEALLYAYEATARSFYLGGADELMEICIAKLWDKEDAGFFSADTEVIGLRLKGIEDLSHPSANSLGIILLLKLYHVTGRREYYEKAERMLKVFSMKAEESGILSGYFYSALNAWFNMLKLTLQTAPGSELADAVLSSFNPYISVVYEEDRGRVIPCYRETCFEPVRGPEAIKKFISDHRYLSDLI
ncbi:MAG TPA: thioredoxin domain-containing protein [Nitrospirae bacterium]|nr:thioredoxin domain-containing protein [Nitrospirota bacterium]